MDFRSIILGDWQLFEDTWWNLTYSVFPFVAILIGIIAFGMLLGVMFSALLQFVRRG